MPSHYDEIGKRLRTFRLDSGLSADEAALRIGISRTALYRLERGRLAKIETLEKLSDLLQISLTTLLGVGIEYMPSAVTYFERTMRLEATADHVVVLAGPVSFLLASQQFERMLEIVLRESVDGNMPDRKRRLEDVDRVMDILRMRKLTYLQRQPSVINLISTAQIDRFLQSGMTGRHNLPLSVAAQRRRMAHEEIEHFISLIERDEECAQIGLVSDTLPHNGFQIFRNDAGSTLTVSPFRLGEQPNIRVGVAMATSAPEAIAVHQHIVSEAWRNAMKGAMATAYLRERLRASLTCKPPQKRF